MKKILAVFCCLVIALSMPVCCVTASAAKTEAEETGAVLEAECSGETLESGGFTFDLSSYRKTATITGFNQRFYAARINTNYDTNHTLIIPSEVEGNDGTKYTVTAISISIWKDGKENNTFKKITIPSSVTSIGSTFSNIESLEYVDFEKGSQLKEIPKSCFQGCTNLIRVGVGSTDELPEGITYIGNYAFQQCKSLKSITLPKGLTAIGSYSVTSHSGYVFEGCENLKEIIIPASLQTIHRASFTNCTGLEKVIFEVYHEGDNKGKSELKILNDGEDFFDEYSNRDNGTFQNCTSLTKVELPIPVTSYAITRKCFKNTGIRTITIPNGVTSISDESFENTPLTGINLPESCTSVGRSAFAKTKLNENGLKTPKGEAYGIAFVCKTVNIDKNAFNSTKTGFRNIEVVDDKVDTIIAGYDNSNADTYAFDNDMKFVSLGDWNPCKITYKGDIDDDGEVDLLDVARLQQHVNGWKDININTDACDVNGDGEVDLLDVARLKQYVNGWDVPIF